MRAVRIIISNIEQRERTRGSRVVQWGGLGRGGGVGLGVLGWIEGFAACLKEAVREIPNPEITATRVGIKRLQND